MIQQGGTAGAMAGLRTTYATTAVPKGWAGHRLEMHNGVGPFITMAPTSVVAGASIFEGVRCDSVSPGFADKVLDDLTLRSNMASSPVLGGAVPPLEAATTLCHRVLSHTTLSFSNLIGPVDEVGLYGHPIVYIAPSSYGHPQALALHFMSYMNKLTIVATVDKQTIPDPHQLLDDLAASIKTIKDVIAGFPIDGLPKDSQTPIQV